MKLTLVITSCFFTLSLLSQVPSIDFGKNSKTTLYGGIDNYVKIKLTPTKDFKVSCYNCDTIYLSKKADTYVIKPTIHTTRTNIYITSSSIPSINYGSKEFVNIPIPNPTLFFGSTRNGNKSNLKRTNLSAKYSSYMNLNVQFEVIQWKLFIGKKTFEGTEEDITDDIKSYLKKKKKLKAFSIIAIVKTPGGIKRKIAGVYTL
jgi:hypothetical protein